MPNQSPQDEPPLPEDVSAALTRHGIIAHDEVALRQELERHMEGYNLFRLTRAAARRWKCRYRVLCDAGYYDGQSAAEAYARVLLAALDASEASG